LEKVFDEFDVTDVIHLAAESHVDRSIVSPLDFVYTNIIGTVNLLNTARRKWKPGTDGTCSTMYQQMKYSAASAKQVISRKQVPTIPIHLILPVKRLRIILSGLTTKPIIEYRRFQLL
jgi:hypothetical protein